MSESTMAETSAETQVETGAEAQSPPQSEPARQETAQENAAPQSGENAGAQEEQAKADPENSPITDWDKTDLGFGKDSGIDPDLYASFGKTAVELGLTPKQAKALAQWQMDSMAQAREQLYKSGAAELSKEWGTKAEHNKNQVISLVSRIDRELGNDSFSKTLGICGATCHAPIVRGLFALSRLISEDSMGKAGGAGMPEKEETVLEGLQDAFRQARGEK